MIKTRRINAVLAILVASTVMLALSSVSASAQDFRRPRHGGHHPQIVEDSVSQVETLTKEKGTYIINTTTIGADVRGFNGRVPLLITIQKDKLQKIEALKNNETPRFMQMVNPLLEKWNGKTVKEAQTMEVDGVTGATFTSKAIKENVKRGIEYYQKNKK